jgi:hypothetical protein
MRSDRRSEVARGWKKESLGRIDEGEKTNVDSGEFY